MIMISVVDLCITPALLSYLLSLSISSSCVCSLPFLEMHPHMGRAIDDQNYFNLK